MSKQRISIKMHSIESRFVIGPSNTLFACVYMSTFQPENLAAGAVKGLGTGAQDDHHDFHTAPGLWAKYSPETSNWRLFPVHFWRQGRDVEWPVGGVRCKGVGKISVGVRPLLPARNSGREQRKKGKIQGHVLNSIKSQWQTQTNMLLLFFPCSCFSPFSL